MATLAGPKGTTQLCSLIFDALYVLFILVATVSLTVLFSHMHYQTLTFFLALCLGLAPLMTAFCLNPGQLHSTTYCNYRVVL